MKWNEKVCYKCHEAKPRDKFARRSGGKSLYRNICIECWNAYYRVFRATTEQRERGRKRMAEWRAVEGNKEKAAKRRHEINRQSPHNVFKLMVFNAKKRAEVLVTKEELFALWEKQDRKCALTGIEMTWGRGKILSTSISLDRINPEVGYSADNIRLVCHAVNAFRGRTSDAEMVEMARAIVTKADAEAGPSWKPYLIHSEAA